MSKLPADCLDEIFENLENDKDTLHSCLLVNRLWCKVSVRILWKSVWNHRTLMACLPDESKDILYKNKIIIPSNSKLPLFNYLTFIKSLKIDSIIKNILKNYQSITPQDLNYKKYIIAQEIFKFVNQISSIRELDISNKDIRSKLLIERLESFFISWASRVSQKSLSLIFGGVNKIYFEKYCENLKVVIETYIKLGVIKEVKFHENYDDDFVFYPVD